MSVGERLKFYRSMRGLSLRGLAKISHVSHSFIKDIESGRSKPSLDTLEALAKALGINHSDLLEEEVKNESNNNLVRDFGDRLIILREERGLEQKEAAELIGVSPATLNRYEKEKREPDLEMLGKLAKFYNVSLDWLIMGNEMPIPDDPKYAGLSVTLEEEFARKGLSPETQREFLETCLRLVEETRKRYNLEEK